MEELEKKIQDMFEEKTLELELKFKDFERKLEILELKQQYLKEFIIKGKSKQDLVEDLIYNSKDKALDIKEIDVLIEFINNLK